MESSIDWKAIFEWPGIAWCVSAVSALSAYWLNLRSHRKTAMFDKTILEVFGQMKLYNQAACQVRDNINRIDISKLSLKDCQYLDDMLTIPIIELFNQTIIMQMFFPKHIRSQFICIYEEANIFKEKMHIVISQGDVACMREYEKYRVAFNKAFTSSMDKLVNTFYSEIFKEWRISTRPWWRRISL